jgi:hypothetical protein
VKERAVLLLCELVLSCPAAQVPHLLESPVVECLAQFLTMDAKELHAVLQALEVIVDVMDDLGDVIPVIADSASVLEELAAHDDAAIADGAANLLSLLSLGD